MRYNAKADIDMKNDWVPPLACPAVLNRKKTTLLDKPAVAP
jgi:hypothetical protein